MRPIICAKCNKPVDKVAVSVEMLGHNYVVWCHGEMERTFLDKFTLHAADNIEPGIAFTCQQESLKPSR